MSTTAVYTFARWQVKQGNLTTVLSLLKQVAQESVAEKGNLFYKAHQSINDPNTLLLYEGYANEAAADGHRNSDHFQNIVVKSIIPLLESREIIMTKLVSH